MPLRHPLRDDIRETLRLDLINGKLRPGAQIRLAPLAERLAVSITPTREALTQLEAEGWVVLHPNRGFFASPLTVAEAESIYPLIAGLEALAIDLQVPFARHSLDRLNVLNESFCAAGSEPDRLLECDRQWHEVLVAGCANAHLLNYLRSIRIRAERYEREYMRSSGNAATSTDDHNRIMHALANSPEQVRVLLREHWDLTLRFMREWLSEDRAAADV